MYDPLTPADRDVLESVVTEFTRIGEDTMRHIGLYQHGLQVESVGFRRWEDWLAGVVVTPWFMNFMLIPTRPDQLNGVQVTEKRTIEMPRGDVVFTVGELDGIGLYLAASLYSPMGRFANQSVAVTTAFAAVDKYFKVPEAEEPTPCNDRA